MELKEDGLHELDIALPVLNEDTFHEIFVPPVELSGDMWPELHGRPSSVSCCDPSVNQKTLGYTETFRSIQLSHGDGERVGIC